MCYGVHLTENQFELRPERKESELPKCPRAEELESSAKALWWKQIAVFKKKMDQRGCEGVLGHRPDLS